MKPRFTFGATPATLLMGHIPTITLSPIHWSAPPPVSKPSSRRNLSKVTQPTGNTPFPVLLYPSSPYPPAPQILPQSASCVPSPGPAVTLLLPHGVQAVLPTADHCLSVHDSQRSPVTGLPA